MSPQLLILALICLAFTGLLWGQARMVRAQKYRSRAFALGGVAALCFALYNGALAFGLVHTLAVLVLPYGSFLLLAATLVSYTISVRNNEMRAERARFEDALQQARERRTQPPATPGPTREDNGEQKELP